MEWAKLQSRMANEMIVSFSRLSTHKANFKEFVDKKYQTVLKQLWDHQLANPSQLKVEVYWTILWAYWVKLGNQFCKKVLREVYADAVWV